MYYDIYFIYNYIFFDIYVMDRSGQNLQTSAFKVSRCWGYKVQHSEKKRMVIPYNCIIYMYYIYSVCIYIYAVTGKPDRKV